MPGTLHCNEENALVLPIMQAKRCDFPDIIHLPMNLS